MYIESFRTYRLWIWWIVCFHSFAGNFNGDRSLDGLNLEQFKLNFWINELTLKETNLWFSCRLAFSIFHSKIKIDTLMVNLIQVQSFTNCNHSSNWIVITTVGLFYSWIVWRWIENSLHSWRIQGNVPLLAIFIDVQGSEMTRDQAEVVAH